MKKIFALLILSLFVLAGCSDDVIGIYFAQPIIKIEADTTSLVRTVPEGDDAGWQAYDSGVDSFTISVQINETAGFRAYVEKMDIYLYDKDGNFVGTIGSKNYIPPIELGPNASDSLKNVWVYIRERHAAAIENTDANERSGYMVYKVFFSDDRGTSYSSIKFFRNIFLRHPEK